MIKIFTGDNRLRASQEITKLLGDNYEVIEGADLTPGDLPSLFHGATLFTDTRNILIRDLSTNPSVFEKLPDYLNTPHQVIIQELKLDKRSATYKSLKNQVEIRDFPLPKNPNLQLVFDIFKTAERNGQKSLQMLAKIKPTEDPIRFFGLLVSQALKNYSRRQGTKEKKVLQELSQLDLQLKSTATDPWLLIEGFLLRVQTLG